MQQPIRNSVTGTAFECVRGSVAGVCVCVCARAQLLLFLLLSLFSYYTEIGKCFFSIFLFKIKKSLKNADTTKDPNIGPSAYIQGRPVSY